MPLVSTRKKATRAGRGAHAIYLPKAWLDAWSPAQAKLGEIDVVSLDEHLILSPVIAGDDPEVHLETEDPETLVRLLLSAYVSGHRAFTVRRSAGFTDAQLTEARRSLRLLDERLDVAWAEDTIHFIRPSADAPRKHVERHLLDLGAKVLEATENLAELLEFFPHNPARVLHAVHLVNAIERDDIQRLKNQSYRQVARLQVPVERVADLQLLMLATHTLARMGKLLVETTNTMGDHLGIPRDRLHYPPELLEPELRKLPAPGPVFRGFVDQARSDLDAFTRLLHEIRTLAETPEEGRPLDGMRALALSQQAQGSHAEVAGHLMGRVQQAWGPGFVQEDPAAIYCVVKVHVHVQDLLEEVRTLADRVADFRLAKTLRPA